MNRREADGPDDLSGMVRGAFFDAYRQVFPEGAEAHEGNSPEAGEALAVVDHHFSRALGRLEERWARTNQSHLAPMFLHLAIELGCLYGGFSVTAAEGALTDENVRDMEALTSPAAPDGLAVVLAAAARAQLQRFQMPEPKWCDEAPPYAAELGLLPAAGSRVPTGPPSTGPGPRLCAA